MPINLLHWLWYCSDTKFFNTVDVKRIWTLVLAKCSLICLFSEVALTTQTIASWKVSRKMYKMQTCPIYGPLGFERWQLSATEIKKNQGVIRRFYSYLLALDCLFMIGKICWSWRFPTWKWVLRVKTNCYLG